MTAAPSTPPGDGPGPAAPSPLDALACGGQPGVPSVAAGTVVTLTATAVEALLAEFVGPLAAIAMVPVAMSFSWASSQVCAVPQPPDPLLTWEDLYNANNSAAGDAYFQAQDRIRQFFTHVIWPIWCNCQNGTTPPPANPIPPPDPVANPGMPPGVGLQSCAVGSSGFLTTHTTESFITLFGDGTHTLPVNASSITVQLKYNQRSFPPNVDGGVRFRVYRAIGTTQVTALDVTVNSSIPPYDHTFSLAVQPTDTFITVSAQSLTAAATTEWTWISYAYCGGDVPGQPEQPCCPPDPLLDARLTQIQIAIQALAQLLNQPTSWKDGVRHHGLSGAGSFMLSGPAIGVRVEMTTLPTGVQVSPGNPNFYWDSGFITPYSFDTPLRGGRLVFQTQSFQIPFVTDMIGYTLLHGCVVDIVELLPVP